MPLIRIDVVQGRTERELQDLLDILHEAMVEAFMVPWRDRYQVLTEHGDDRLIMLDTGLGFERSAKRILVQVLTRPRSPQSKQDFYRRAVEGLEGRLGIHPDDVMFACVENADVDWSFGRGKAQFLTGEL